MRKLITALVAVCGAVAALALASSVALAQAQKTYILKFNHVLGPKEPYHDGFMKWAKRGLRNAPRAD